MTSSAQEPVGVTLPPPAVQPTSSGSVGSSGSTRPDDLNLFVDLDALTGLADELNAQAQLLTKYSMDLGDVDTALSDLTLPGRFPEAETMAEAHKQALVAVKSMIEQLRDLTSFADQVTSETARRYVDRDENAAQSLSKVAVDIESPVARMARWR